MLDVRTYAEFGGPFSVVAQTTSVMAEGLQLLSSSGLKVPGEARFVPMARKVPQMEEEKVGSLQHTAGRYADACVNTLRSSFSFFLFFLAHRSRRALTPAGGCTCRMIGTDGDKWVFQLKMTITDDYSKKLEYRHGLL